MLELITPEDVRQKRIELGLTQSELASRAGVSQPLIARIESGDVDPRLSTLRRIVDALNSAEQQKSTVRDVMHSPVIWVTPDERVGELVRLMDTHGFSQVPVFEEGVCIGSVSADTIAAHITQTGAELTKEMYVRDIMEEPFPTVPLTDDLSVVVNLLRLHPAVLMVEEGNIMGVITKHDIIRLVGLDR
ncbi:MAG: CBS domain-containing protein [Methermicoccaceae archaeon]